MKHLLALALLAVALQAQTPQPLNSPYQDYRHLGEFDFRSAKMVRPKVVLLTPIEDSVCLNPYEEVYSYSGGSKHICQPSTYSATSGTWQTISGGSGGVPAITGDSGTVTVDPLTGKVNADITEIMAQPLAPTSSFDVSGATVTKPFKRVTSAPSGACDGTENAIQMVASTGAKWRCDETTDTWVSDAPAVTTFIPLMMGSSVFTDGSFFAGPPNGAQTATNVYPYHFYSLADSATHRIGWQIPAPASLPSTVNVYFDIYQADDNGGDVRVRITTACIAVSSAIGASPTIVGTSTQTVTMPSVYQAGARVTATGLSTSGCASQHMYVAIERLGSDAADTMTNALRVHGGMLTW